MVGTFIKSLLIWGSESCYINKVSKVQILLPYILFVLGVFWRCFLWYVWSFLMFIWNCFCSLWKFCKNTNQNLLIFIAGLIFLFSFKAAARHQCSYLVNLHVNDFLHVGGDPKWLNGLENAPQKLQNLGELNKVLAHRPWLITKEHIEVSRSNISRVSLRDFFK